LAKKRARSPARKKADDGPPERRTRHALREVLNELIEHVRTLAQASPELSSGDMEYAQQRLEWLADEIWRLTQEQDDRS